ncbi:MAG: hypothetical protein NT076_05695 [Candidatus Pacearchaeota archaeon]|nr:hypothetical protein [Candidatus Pacearchaeota archaeon]
MNQPVQGEKDIAEARLSDNYIKMLIYRTRNQSDKMVAHVILRRTYGNYLEWVFSSPINQMTDEEL